MTDRVQSVTVTKEKMIWYLMHLIRYATIQHIRMSFKHGLLLKESNDVE